MTREIVITVGLVLSITGLVGIISVAYIGIKIKKEETKNLFDKRKHKSIFQTLIAVNYAALLTSSIGLIVVIIGLMIN